MSRSYKYKRTNLLIFLIFIELIFIFPSQVFSSELICKVADKPIKIKNTTLNIKDFYVSNMSDQDVFENAFRCAEEILNKNGFVYIIVPSGNFKITKPVELNQKKNNWKSILIKGQGINQTNIFSENGVFKISLSTREPLVNISDISIIATIKNGGTAIEVYIPPGGNRHNRSLIIENLQIQGLTAKSDTYFETGIKATGVWRAYLRNVFMTGPFGPKAPKYSESSACFILNEAYSPEILNCACWSAGIGLKVYSESNPAPEGIQVISSKFVNVNIGIWIENKISIEPEMLIINNHINVEKIGIYIKNKKYGFINNNLFYSEGIEEFKHVFLENTEKIFIKDNIFHYPSRISPKKESFSVFIDSNNEDIYVCDNLFNSPGIGIYVKKGVKNFKTQCSNEFFLFNKITGLKLNNIKILNEGGNSNGY